MKNLENVKTPTMGTWRVVEFESLQEFYEYITTSPLNYAFTSIKHKLSSNRSNERNWFGTESFGEATELFRNGWSIGAQELTQKLKMAESNKEVQNTYKNILSFCGYQAIVPLYLNGVPNNMVNKKIIPVKKKVITINKALSCSCCVSSETMMNESVKAFQIIKKIEATGIRVNLNLLISTGHVCVKIKLKSANERLNISKLAFPLVHPSMFRRLYFRFIEVYPTIPNNYKYGYGRVPEERDFKAVCGKDEILLPTLLSGSTEDEIKKLSIDELIEKLNVK